MIQQFCEVLRDRIALLPYADVVAGLVRIAEKRKELTDEQTGEVYRIDIDTFPVVQNIVGGKCYAGQYKDIAPDSKKKSVIYFEPISNVNIEFSRGNKMSAFGSKIALVCWLNLPKLGRTNDEDLFDLRMQLIATCTKVPVVITYKGLEYKATLKPTTIKSSPEIFSKYSYDKHVINNMLLYPYQYFSIEFDIDFFANVECFTFVPDVAIC
jgi:hypothetical protein